MNLFLVTIAFCALPLISYVAMATRGQESETVTLRVAGDLDGSGRAALLYDDRLKSSRRLADTTDRSSSLNRSRKLWNRGHAPSIVPVAPALMRDTQVLTAGKSTGSSPAAYVVVPPE